MPFKIPINQLTPDFHDSGYKITGPDINDRRVIVNSITLKVEKETAKAMIEGFDKIDGRYYVTIYTANKKAWSLLGNFRENPKIIATLDKRRPAYELSRIGKLLFAHNYNLQAKYVAVLDTVFYIKENDKKIWEILCNNGIYDIWDPIAPYRRLGSSKEPMILLLRIFEVDYDFSNEIIKEGWPYCDAVKQRIVKIVKPIIANIDFGQIMAMIRESINDYIINEENVCNTLQLL